MNCPYCGIKPAVGERSCHNCGAAVADREAVRRAEPTKSGLQTLLDFYAQTGPAIIGAPISCYSAPRWLHY